MKNLKKVLSLVLALAMALSLMTAAFAKDASDYNDYNKVTYKEAVDVMTAIGVFDGMNSTTFAPDGTLTREQAAKIITYMLLGKDAADKLTATIAPYSDVPASRWSAGAIAYCTNEGILSGVGHGKFDPTGELTGVAFAKMLLVALGYDPTIEQFTGDSWAINVSKRALGDADLDKDMDKISLSAQLTREQAAQMAFNAMQANVVDYENRGSSIIINGIEIAQGASKAEPVKDSGNKKGTIAKDEILQFAEKYCEKLSVSTKSSDKADDFGRPAITWVYDKETVGAYADSADQTYVVNSGDKDLETIVTGSDYMDQDASDILSTAKVYRNGDSKDYSADKTNKVGKGDIVEVYQNDDGDVTTIVVRSYTYAKIDKVDSDLGSALTKKGASYSITLKDIAGSSIGGTYYDDYENNSAVVLQGFNASTYTEDAVLAVALNGGAKVLDSYVADAVTGTPSSAKAVAKASTLVTDGNVTISGEKYEYAGTMTGLNNNENVAFDKEYTIYLSKDGYVIGVDGSAAVSLDDVYYVTGVYREINKGETNYYAQAVSLKDGKTSDILLEENDNSTILANKPTDKFIDTAKGLYTFTDDKGTNSKADDGKFNATKYDGSSNTYAVVTDKLNADVSKSSVSVQFKTGTGNTTGQSGNSNTGKLYITKNTQFLGIESKGSTLKVSSAIGMMQQAANTDVIAIFQDGKTEAVYVLYVGDTLNSTISTADVVYLTDKTSTENSKGYEGTLYFMDSKDSKNVTVKDKKDKAGFFTYKVDKDDVYELTGDGNAISGTVTIGKSNTGSVMDLPITNSYNQNLTGTAGSVTFNDVDYSGATVIDTRSESDRNKDVYTAEINSPSALEAAVKKGNDVVTKANVYVEDGKITFIAVTEVKNDTAAPGGETGDKNYTISNASLGKAASKFAVTFTTETALTTSDTVTVKITKKNQSEGDGVIATKTVNATANKTQTNLDTTIAVPASGNYTAEITVKNSKGDVLATTTIEATYIAQ